MAAQQYDENGATRTTSVGTLVNNLFDHTSHLVRQEFRLVKAEVQAQVTETVSTMGQGVVLLLVGGVFGVLGLAFLGITLIAALTQFLGWQLWVAALVVTVAYLVLGGLLAFIGRKQLAVSAPVGEIHASPANEANLSPR